MSAQTEELAVGRELDMAVHAAVFGDDWRKECSRFRQSRCNGRIYTHCGACGQQGHGNCYGQGRGPIEMACADGCGAPAYSTDIAAAWLLAERMRDKCPMAGYGLDGVARCELWVGGIELVNVEAETVPLAICRAALKALAG